MDVVERMGPQTGRRIGRMKTLLSLSSFGTGWTMKPEHPVELIRISEVFHGTRLIIENEQSASPPTVLSFSSQVGS